MLGQLAKEHIEKRLKAVQLGGIFFMTIVASLLYAIGVLSEIKLRTLPAVLISAGMAATLTLGYLSVLPQSRKESMTPLFLFYFLNILSSALIWATGIFQSPFILLYPVVIIVVSQLYSYRHGLLHALLAIVGFIFVYGATVENVIPFLPILPRASIESLYQPPLNIILYGLIYAFLFFFTLYSSSSARAILYRPSQKNDLNQTYQETIIEEMPLGLMVVDEGLNILTANPAAMIKFPFKGTPSLLTDYLSLPKVAPKSALMKLAKNGETKMLTWTLDSGEILPISFSANYMKGSSRGSGSFLLFLQ